MANKGPRIKASPARLAALEVNSLVRTRKAFTQEIIASHLDPLSLSAEDRAFATKLSLGVTSSWGTLDEVIDQFLHAPADLQPRVRDALRISTYEILFLDKSPHAAIDQGVELAKSVNPKTSGLANAVLRKVAFAKEDFPFGDPQTDNAALGRIHAFPLWLTERLIKDIGREAAELFMRASNEPAPLFLSVNEIRASRDEVQSVFKQIGAVTKQLTSTQFGFEGCLRLGDPRMLQHPLVKKLFVEGKILVSDASSQMIAHIALPQKEPHSFLEIGAGRGTKSILLQSDSVRRFGHQINLSVLDAHEFKINLLKRRMKEYGVALDTAYVGDARSLSDTLKNKRFEAAFIDAPCSGLGTLRRHPEIRWRLKAEDITSLAGVGLSLLHEVAGFVERGGSLTYSTCSVMAEENTEVVRNFLMTERGTEYDIEPVGGRNVFATALKPGSSDAHFAVRLVHKS